MEAQHQAAHEDNNGGSGSGGNKGGNFICSSRQTSTRWTPTSEQIRILKELYYNSGLRSPTADQIQKISATLRQYGKIEGKNVFYWFQNHKARERQKKRFSASTTTTTTGAATPTNVSDHLPLQKANTFVTTHDNKFSNNFALGHHGLSSAGQMGNYGSYGSVAMEKSFGNCSISASQVDQQDNYAYVGIENYSPYNYTNFFDKKKPIELEEDQEYCYFNDHHQQQEDHQEAEPRSYQIRKTLELFPVPNFHEDHDHHIKTGFMNFRSASSWFGSDLDHHHGDHHHHHAGSRASLELTLNSYTAFSGSNDCV